jgi:hypothetical protein
VDDLGDLAVELLVTVLIWVLGLAAAARLSRAVSSVAARLDRIEHLLVGLLELRDATKTTTFSDARTRLHLVALPTVINITPDPLVAKASVLRPRVELLTARDSFSFADS